MAKKVLLTSEGLEKLQDELDNLKNVRRKENTAALKVAKSFGDLSENSEYDEAKNEQAEIEARILEIENMLKNAEIIDEDDVATDVVSIGSRVTVKDLDDDDATEYFIVGSTEADPMKGKISDESPVGSALLGHKVGETVAVEAPMGIIKYEIVNISK
ncbi:MAG: transcription elongation factor GreA [Ruminococcaceae bacterium]|nr:transcription elongation factor GreA [Oscillospiraceae bacterium]